MAEKKQWHETLHDQFGQYFAVDNVLYHEKTDHQDLIIFENAAFGRVMALDGVVQRVWQNSCCRRRFDADRKRRVYLS